MEYMKNRDIIPQYKDSVMHFALYAARIAYLADLKEKGVPVDKGDIAYAGSCLSSYKEYLLEDKAALGFTDGLEFLEDNKFFGFEIKGGKFLGEPESVLPIVTKWLDGFPETANHYQYEVSCLVMCLAHPELYDEFSGETSCA